MFDIRVNIIINDILQSCTYILSKDGESGIYLVDCGDAQPVFDYLNTHHKEILGILLTHCHYDHIYGLNEILGRAPNIQIFASERTLQGLEDVDMNMSYLYTDEDYLVSLNSAQKISTADKVNFQVFGKTVKCIATPGHDLDCTTFVVGDLIFTGDSYNPDSPVYTKWENSNVEEAKISESFIKRLITGGNLIVYPGHIIRENDRNNR